MRKFLMLTLFFQICFTNTFSQINSHGQAFIRNYSIKEYNAMSQNWDVVQDSQGIMYFANTDGVLQYDGRNWELIKINKSAIVRSIAIDSQGVIYVGAENEFGYIKSNKFSKLYYTSLSDSLLKEDQEFANINKIYAIDNSILFCSNKKIFTLLNDTLHILNLPNGGFLSIKVNDDLYMGEYYQGLMKLHENKFILCIGGEFYINMDIFSIIPYNTDELIIATSDNGLFIYNTKSGVSNRPNSENYKKVHDFIINNILYSAFKYKDGFRINTLYGGSLICDSSFNIIETYNKNSGLQDEVILGSYKNNDNSISSVLWLTLNNGISKVENNSALRYFNESYGLDDEILDIIEFDDKLYFATINGVYTLETKNGFPVFKHINETEGGCWSIIKYKNKLLIAGGYDIYTISGTKISSITLESSIFKLKKSLKYPGQIYIGTQDGILISRLYNDKLINLSNIKISDKIVNIVEDSKGDLWLTTGSSELIKVSMLKEDTLISYYNDSYGFPQTESLYTFKYKDDIFFSTKENILKYNQGHDKVEQVADEDFSFHKEAINAVYEVEDKEGDIWIVSDITETNRIKLFRKNSENNFTTIQTPFLRIPNCMINVIYPDKNGIVWLGTSEGLFTFNSNIELKYDEPYNTLIRKVFVGEDSILYYGNLLLDQTHIKPILDYKNNGLTFHYSASFYIEESETKFSYSLEGFDKEGWSKWTNDTKSNYTNLHEGSYTFKVKAKNIYGIESTIAEYSFEIDPPWYRTLIAYIVYVILFVAFVWTIVKLNIRRLQYEKKKLEGIVKERTAEIREKKDEIEKQKEEITDSIKYAKRIQTAILPPDELISKQLPEYFILFKPRDIVSGDFYWMKQIGDYTLIAAADCTGHGVPGAFMSMLGIAFLNEIVKQEDVLSASDILTELRNHVKLSLRQTGKEGEAKDGMDIAFCVINKKEMKLQFAGAYNPLYLFRNVNQPNLKEFEGLKITEDEKYNLNEIKADKMPIGIHIAEKDNFTNYEIDLKTGDTLYIFSDGYSDQIGGEKNKKFMSKNLKNLLFEIQDKDMSQQKVILNETIENWKGNEEQMDDIVLIGIRI